MHSAENYQDAIKLLSTVQLEEVVAMTADIFVKRLEADAVGILTWDPDLEIVADRFAFGPRKKELTRVLAALGEELSLATATCQKGADLGVNLPENLDPIRVVPLFLPTGELLGGFVLIGNKFTDEALEQFLKEYPFAQALHHAWQFTDLTRENERLRGQYEELEDKTGEMEEQTMKLIHDVTARDSVRFRQVERDRLVYWISNAVRSSVHIQEVLETAVEKIGPTVGVSRCMLLRAVDTSEQFAVYEFTQPGVSSVKECFFTDDGFDFIKEALNRTAPEALEDPDTDRHMTYNRDFMRVMGIRSGLIAPLIMRQRVVGALFLQDVERPREWSIDDISLIGALADNLSVAIENAELHTEIERQAVTDALTGVANRRCFTETFAKEFERARRYGETLSLVIIDLDFLKKINDNFGHQFGDEAIRSIGKVLKQSSRSVDLPARYGGEEFCVLLPNTSIEMAQQLAERLRKEINDVVIEGPGRISASVGVASYPHDADDTESLFQVADEALYAAKQSGRNKVCVASQLPANILQSAGASGAHKAAPPKVEGLSANIEAVSDTVIDGTAIDGKEKLLDRIV